MLKQSKQLLKNSKHRLINTWRKILLAGENYENLHLGSGKIIIPGWYNIDFDDQFGPAVHQLDLCKPLPFPDASVSRIFSEHLIEHLPKTAGLQLLRECYRVIKPGGSIRFGWPDLTKHLAAYHKKDNKYRKSMHPHMGPNLTDSWDEFFSDLLYSWDHRYMYTPELLRKYFVAAGFKKAKISAYNKSKLGFLWDTRDFPDTSYIEAKK